MKYFLKIQKVGLAILALIGCGLAGCGYTRQLSVLKGLGDSQKEIERYVVSQERGFNKLSDDIKNNRLKIGLSKDEALSLYGEPVLFKRIEDNPLLKEELLYRLPTEYFSTNRIYLYFDIENKLVKWTQNSSP